MDETLEKLLAQPLLNMLTDEEVEAIRPFVQLRQVPAGHAVFHQDEPPDYFYIITAGEFEVVMSEEEGHPPQRINLLYPKDFFGDVSFLIEEPRGVTIRAIEDSEVLYMTGEEMLRLRDEYPGFADRMNALGQRIETRSIRTFAGQREGEVVLYYERLHWFALVQRLLPTFFITLLWALVVALIVYVVRGSQRAVENTLLFSPIFLFIPAGLLVWHYLDWYNDYYIVTNHRVVQIVKVIGFLEQRFETALTKIQSVRADSPNPAEEWLGFGTMYIATAAQGSQSTLRFTYMRDAEHIAEIIIQELNRFRKSNTNERRDAKRRALQRALGEDPAGPAPPPPPTVPTPPTPLGRVHTFLDYFRPHTRTQIGKTVVWRKHPVILLTESWPAWTAFFASIYLAYAVPVWLQIGGRGLAAWWTFSLIWIGLMVFWIWWRYEDWRNDRYVLTEDAIVDEEVKPFGFLREVRRAPLDSIQDIRYEQTNPIQIVFNVGRVVIQTAGQQGMFTFDWVSCPGEVQSDISEYIQERKDARERQEAEAMRQEVLDLITIYDEQRRGKIPPPPRSDDPDATRPSTPVV